MAQAAITRPAWEKASVPRSRTDSQRLIRRFIEGRILSRSAGGLTPHPYRPNVGVRTTRFAEVLEFEGALHDIHVFAFEALRP